MISQPETVYRLERPLLAGDQAAQDPVMAALPPGWVGLRDSNVSGLLNHPLPVAYVLLHPQTGVALLDFSPGHLDGAAAALHHRLEAARFEAIFPGHLPITELTLTQAEVPGLARILAASFAALPPLSVPGGDGWISVVRRALQPRDPARAATPATAPVGGIRLVRPREARFTTPPAAEHLAASEAMGDDPGSHLDAQAAPGPTPRRGGIGLALLGGAALAGLTLAGAAMVWHGAEGPIATLAEAPPTIETPEPAPGLPTTVPGLAVPRGPEATGAPAPLPPAARPAPLPEVRAVPPAAIRPAPPADIRSAPPPEARPIPPPPAAVAPPPAASRLPPPPPPPAASGARTVVRSAANLRASPDTRARILRTAPAGESFRVYGSALGGWVQVGDTEPQGWIHSKLLRDAP
jgi:hypothetical protein